MKYIKIAEFMSIGSGSNSELGYWQDIKELENLMNSKVPYYRSLFSLLFNKLNYDVIQ